jgi:hypothetical protein
VIVAGLLVGTSVAGFADSPEDATELRRLIEEQRRLLLAQGDEIARLRQELDQLRKAVEARAATGASAASTGPPLPASANPQPTPAPSPAVAVKHADDGRRLPEDVGKTVDVDDFPGGVALPGTDARIRPGGWVRATFVNTRDPMGTNDRFAPSSILVGPLSAADDTNETGSVFTARPTRLNLDLRTPTGVGAMRAFVEADFEGSDGGVRLRHAYGRWGRLLLGQTWSAFGDIKAEPDSINREGFSAATHLRQPGVRVSFELSASSSLAVALEAPDPGIEGAPNVSGAPDGIVRFRYEQADAPHGGAYSLFGDGAHFQAAVVLRQLGARAPDGSKVYATGFGAGLTTRVALPRIGDRDWLLGGLIAGKGVGRYVRDLEEAGGQDAVFDPATGELEALPVLAGYVALEHWWATTVRTTFAAGVVHVDNLDFQPDDALHRTGQFSLNLAWSPIRRLDLVTELLWGRRVNKSGADGRAKQIQVGSTFRF